ncbi:hypothetical protein PAXRUDRAFT_832971 [Paxillus rubicundulus Ve08.2h10]|uniref:F-box domain-containing protein n=1 Tax=Paxillus rubicundulus Ve08.2h10 TaxID=930991 RepID=A0A0D0DIA2_9AGAM|nr:hypothetical protein PAXRUDRAFT_832971 [Paxillus rubicundulus Ve08.2h10]
MVVFQTDPLTAIPCELVGYIFYLWLVDSIYPDITYSDSQLPVLLCLVSKSWRNFVYSSPVLWSHIIIDASKGAVPALHALKKRLQRSQIAPLFLDIVVGEPSDRDALRVLFAESSRFCHLTLSILDLSWRNDILVQGFTQLAKFTVHTGFQVLPYVDTLGMIFSSAPRLRYVKWHSMDDPGPVAVNGHQLHFLHLTVIHTPATRVLDVLVACPNLRDVVIRFYGEHEYIHIPPRERMSLPELRSLVLDGNRDLTGVLRSVQAPLLSRLDIHWRSFNGREDGLEALHSLLEYSPHLEEIALCRFLETEEGLISILTTNRNLVTLTVVSEPYRKRLITRKTFQFLTRQGQDDYPLPQLEKLVFRNALDVEDVVVVRMIESRMAPPDDKESTSRSRRACILNSVCLSGCKRMAAETISQLEAVCQESGLRVEGDFVNGN